MALRRDRGRFILILEDPGGVLLGALPDRPMKLGLGLNLCVTLGLAEALADLHRQMLLAVSRGKLVTPITRKFKLSEAAVAQQLAEASHVGGKIMLVP